MEIRTIWISTAWQQYRQVMEYFAKNGWLQAYENFEQAVEKRLERVRAQPFSGHPSQIEGIRFVIVKKRWHLYYRFDEPSLYILYLWDTKMHPRRNPFGK